MVPLIRPATDFLLFIVKSAVCESFERTHFRTVGNIQYIYGYISPIIFVILCVRDSDNRDCHYGSDERRKYVRHRLHHQRV